jgi:hypothetical protein
MPPEMKGPARSAKAEAGPKAEQRGALNSCQPYNKNLRANQADRRRAWWCASTLDDIDAENLRLQYAHLHDLGPRLHEFVRSLLGGRDILIELESYQRLDVSIARYVGADRLLAEEARQ